MAAHEAKHEYKGADALVNFLVGLLKRSIRMPHVRLLLPLGFLNSQPSEPAMCGNLAIRQASETFNLGA